MFLEKYTSHCFRRSGATFLADGGISLENLKRFGRWKSTTCAERYVADSSASKTDLALRVSAQPHRLAGSQSQSSQVANQTNLTQISSRVHLEKGKESSTEVSMTRIAGDSRTGSCIFGGAVSFTNCAVTINVCSPEHIPNFPAASPPPPAPQ